MGSYTCIAENMVGKTEASAVLTVQGMGFQLICVQYETFTSAILKSKNVCSFNHASCEYLEMSIYEYIDISRYSQVATSKYLFADYCCF